MTPAELLHTRLRLLVLLVPFLNNNIFRPVKVKQIIVDCLLPPNVEWFSASAAGYLHYPVNRFYTCSKNEMSRTRSTTRFIGFYIPVSKNKTTNLLQSVIRQHIPFTFAAVLNSHKFNCTFSLTYFNILFAKWGIPLFLPMWHKSRLSYCNHLLWSACFSLTWLQFFCVQFHHTCVVRPLQLQLDLPFASINASFSITDDFIHEFFSFSFISYLTPEFAWLTNRKTKCSSNFVFTACHRSAQYFLMRYHFIISVHIWAQKTPMSSHRTVLFW